MSDADLLTRVSKQIDHAQGVQLIIPEDTGVFSIEDALVHDVRALLDDTVALMRDVVDHYESLGEDPGDAVDQAFDALEETDFLKEIGAQISSELASREVADLAYFGRQQLIDIRESLQRSLAEHSIWKIASYADTGLRRVNKALIALEAAMRDFEGLPPVEREWEDVDQSLEIRLIYTQFRRETLVHETPDSTIDIRLLLIEAGKRIKRLREHEIYPFMRIDDRRQIRTFQKRILA
ncbi:MAG: hypothetical protein AAF772_10715, partial [Acidobacteriota bacterium]